MRIIQSFWAANSVDVLQNNMGWLSPEYNVMSWALSCLQLRKFYPEVVLYCDTIGAKLLIKDLKLPYSEVICSLDSLNNYNPSLWALPKIKAYSRQTNPFLHVDGDVYIFEKFDDDLIKSGLIAQNKDQISDFENTMRQLESHLDYFPDEIIAQRISKNPIQTYNAGIYGGSDIDFFQEYTAKAFKFVNKNTQCLNKINIGGFNIFFEQYLFYCLANNKKKKVSTLLPNLIKDKEYKGFGDFDKVPFEKTYLHLLSDYKKSELMCNELANRLRQDYPIYYYRIIELFKKNKISLFKNYSFYNHTTQKELLQKDFKFKVDFKNSNVEKFKKNDSNIKINEMFFRNIKHELDSKNKFQIKDFNVFIKKLLKIIELEFSMISIDYLYARDLNKTQYFELLFGDLKNIYIKVLIADKSCKIINSQFDYSYFFERNGELYLNVNPLPSSQKNNIKTLLIPECDDRGFSICNLDELDVIIFKMLNKNTTIEDLFSKLSEYFNEDDLNESKIEFEKLIFKKINKAIQNKSIRIII